MKILCFRASALLFLTAAVSFAVSCERELDYHRNDIQPQLMLSAQLIAGEPEHVVHLSISKDVRVDKISSGSVKCFVNGSLIAEGKEVDGDAYMREDASRSWLTSNPPSKSNQTSYAFQADFKPGDVVVIEATANGGEYSARSTLVVPKAPAFEIVDTLLMQNGNTGRFSHERVFKVRIKGKDVSGEKSFYRLTAGYYKVNTFHGTGTVYYGPGGETVTDDSKTWTEEESGQLGIEAGNDPILNDGAPAEDLDIMGASENIFNAFSDNLFADGSFDIGFQVPAYSLVEMPSGSYNRAEVDSELIVTVSGLSEAQYNYLKSMNLYQYNYGELTLAEAITFPDNVEGGVGIVGISTPATASIHINTRRYSLSGVYYQGRTFRMAFDGM